MIYLKSEYQLKIVVFDVKYYFSASETKAAFEKRGSSSFADSSISYYEKQKCDDKKQLRNNYDIIEVDGSYNKEIIEPEKSIPIGVFQSSKNSDDQQVQSKSAQ